MMASSFRLGKKFLNAVLPMNTLEEGRGGRQLRSNTATRKDQQGEPPQKRRKTMPQPSSTVADATAIDVGEPQDSEGGYVTAEENPNQGGRRMSETTGIVEYRGTESFVHGPVRRTQRGTKAAKSPQSKSSPTQSRSTWIFNTETLSSRLGIGAARVAGMRHTAPKLGAPASHNLRVGGDGADGQFMLNRRPRKSHLISVRPQHGVGQTDYSLDEEDELGFVDGASEPRGSRRQEDRSGQEHSTTSGSLETRGDMKRSFQKSPAKEGIELELPEPHLPIMRAVSHPDHIYDKLDRPSADEKLGLYNVSFGAPVARAFRVAPPFKLQVVQSKWLRVDHELARKLYWNPNSPIIFVTQRLASSRDEVSIGSAMAIEFGTASDARKVFDWFRAARNGALDKEFAIERESPDRLARMYDKLQTDVKQYRESRTRPVHETENLAWGEGKRGLNGGQDTKAVMSTTPSKQYTTSRVQRKTERPEEIEDDEDGLRMNNAPRPPRSMSTRQRTQPSRQSQRQTSPPAEKAEIFTEQHPSWDASWKMPLVYERTTVERDDIPRLDEGQCLNDNIIGFYLQYLVRKNPETASRVFFHNSFFFDKLKNGKAGKGSKINYDGVKKWTARVDIFACDYIVVPVNEHFHWWVAIICRPGKLLRQTAGTADAISSSASSIVEVAPIRSDLDADDTSADLGDSKRSRKPVDYGSKSAAVELDSDDEPKEVSAGPLRPAKKIEDPTAFRIITLDSLGHSHSPTVGQLKDYLLAELKDKRSGEDVEMPQRPGMTAKNIPIQDNFNDCGVYLLGYMEKFLQDPDYFVQSLVEKEDSPWDFSASKLRVDIRNLIFKLQKAYQEERQKERKLKASAAKRQKSQQPSEPKSNQPSSRAETPAKSPASVLASHGSADASANTPTNASRMASSTSAPALSDNQLQESELMNPPVQPSTTTSFSPASKELPPPHTTHIPTSMKLRQDSPDPSTAVEEQQVAEGKQEAQSVEPVLPSIEDSMEVDPAPASDSSPVQTIELPPNEPVGREIETQESDLHFLEPPSSSSPSRKGVPTEQPVHRKSQHVYGKPRRHSGDPTRSPYFLATPSTRQAQSSRGKPQSVAPVDLTSSPEMPTSLTANRSRATSEEPSPVSSESQPVAFPAISGARLARDAMDVDVDDKHVDLTESGMQR